MITIPSSYKPKLSVYETQKAIDYIKRTFQMNLAIELNLRRVSAPLFVRENSGLNDNLNGVERPVKFDVPAVGEYAEVVHSLAKWKRLALKRYDFFVGKGIYTDMNAIRRDEELDNIHSVYVDQWDWEKVIDRSMRNEEYLRLVVKKIVAALVATNNASARSRLRFLSSRRRSLKTCTPTKLRRKEKTSMSASTTRHSS